LPDEELPADEAPIVKMSAASAAAGGEPWLTRFDPEKLQAKLAAMGFSEVIHLSPREAAQRFFGSRRDGLRPFAMEQMMRAIV
jgi:O-methyltransferase involved in polyketide biosynthesis